MRAKDTETPMAFGRPSEDRHQWGNGIDHVVAASDYYSSHRIQEWQRRYNNGGTTLVHNIGGVNQISQMPLPVDWRTMPSAAYTRTLPLHALKKVAFIEREFKAGHPIFLVSDYTVTADIVVNPDPFLMAVIPNSAVAHGKGRFIIDVWDEPGFGIDRMLK